MQEIKKFLQNERATKKIYPEGKNVFRAFDLCLFDNTKVVIIGQDPYHTPGTADGLAFSTQQKVIPPSLQVIFKEIYKDMNIQYYHEESFEKFFPTGNLESWAKNGFLMLNTVLTVEEGKPNSHKDLGWVDVIQKVFDGLNQKDHQVIFLLWGKEAQKYKSLIDPKSKHIVLNAAHPATELYNDNKGGFYGCGHFSAVRDILPGIEGRNIFTSAKLDACFDKEKAKLLVKERYPIDAEAICEYIDDEMIIHVPINKEIYWKEVRKFEELISTKIESNG